MQPHENGETGLSCIALSHIFIGNSRAQLRWLSALRIVESRANLKLDAIITAYQDGTAHVRAPPCPLLVTNDCSFRIVKLLDFKQQVATPVLIGRIGVLDHDTLTTGSGDLVELLSHVLEGLHLGVLNELEEFGAWHLFVYLVKDFVDLIQSLFESALHLGSIEDHVLDALPFLILVLPPHNADDLLEIGSLTP